MNSDPRGLRTDGMNGDTKGCGIAQRYYQTSIVAGYLVKARNHTLTSEKPFKFRPGSLLPEACPADWATNQYGKYELQFDEFDRLDMGIDEASNWTSGRYMWYCPEMYSNDLTQDPCVRMRFRLDCSSSNGKQDGEDKVQYSEIDHLAMVPAKAPIRMHLGQFGQSGQYGENHEPRLKTSERPDLHAEPLFRFTMFGLQRKSNKEKHPRLSVSQTSFKYALNTFDEFVDVQEKPIWWSKEHVNTSKDVADPKRQHFQFDVQQFCDNFVKGVDKALKDVSKSQKKSTSTRAQVAEPSFSISKKTQGESENCFEEFKDFSDSSPIFDETDEEPIESLMSCEESCDLPYLESEFINDNEQANVELTVLQPEHPIPEPIFDEEDEPDPVFDEEATSIISTFMESHLCFDSGTTTAPSSPAPLLHDLQEHCEEPSSLNSLPDMVVKPDLLSFETDNTWHFLRSFRDNGVVLSSDDILVYNTFFEKCLELLINDSQTELKLVCSDVGKDMPILKMNTVDAYLDKILVCNIYFDEHLERLKNERQVQPLNESIGRAQQPQIWRSFVVQTGYLGASDRGSVQEHEDQDVLKFSTEVHDFHHTGQTDRTVPNASGWELWLEPWPDDRFHYTGLCLHRPVFHLMKNSRDGIAFGRTDPELGHCYTFLDSTTCTARMSSLRLHQYPCPDDRIHRTGARISCTDWNFKSNGRDRFGFGRVELKIGHDTSKLATLDCPACVLAQSAGHASGSNEPGRNLKGFSLVKV
ncbi:hypothetical protein YC2023_004359 [Brassica napus]